MGVDATSTMKTWGLIEFSAYGGAEVQDTFVSSLQSERKFQMEKDRSDFQAERRVCTEEGGMRDHYINKDLHVIG